MHKSYKAIIGALVACLLLSYAPAHAADFGRGGSAPAHATPSGRGMRFGGVRLSAAMSALPPNLVPLRDGLSQVEPGQ